MLILKTAPLIEPVTTAQLAAFLRLDVGDDDMLSMYITAARQQIENYLRRSLICQTWLYMIDEKNVRMSIDLPRPPLGTVSSVKTYDYASIEHTQLSTDYIQDTYHEPGRIFLKPGHIWGPYGFREFNAMLIEYVCGYGDDATDVPAELRAAIIETAAYWFTWGEIGELPTSTTTALRPLVVPVL